MYFRNQLRSVQYNKVRYSLEAAVIRRGFVPSDERDFAANQWPLLRRAQSDLQVMLDRGYPIKSVSRLVGDHYQLTER